MSAARKPGDLFTLTVAAILVGFFLSERNWLMAVLWSIVVLLNLLWNVREMLP